MNVLSQADDSVSSKCINCGALVSTKAKFCEECGALQAAPPISSPEPVGEISPEATVKKASMQKKLIVLFGIVAAVVLIVSACLAWFKGHPTNPEAQYELGYKYAEGQGVPKDDSRAVSWFQKSAEQGYPVAQYELGFMYDHGRGVPKNDTQAIYWYKKSADQGDAIAQYTLGTEYDSMVVTWSSIPKDDAQAISWYQKAADQAYAPAKDALAKVNARQARMKTLSDWVAANLNGHQYDNEGPSDSSGGHQRTTESVSATVDGPCALHIVEQSRIAASVPGKDDWNLDFQSDCRVNLFGFRTDAVTIEGDTNQWQAKFEDNDAVQCVESGSLHRIYGPENTRHFTLFFSDREKAKQLVDGLGKLVHDSCPTQAN